MNETRLPRRVFSCAHDAPTRPAFIDERVCFVDGCFYVGDECRDLGCEHDAIEVETQPVIRRTAVRRAVRRRGWVFMRG